jgi:hypothetical protein
LGQLLWVVAICLPAILPLLWRPQWEFGIDWATHVYPIGYQGQYLRQHHWFSETLNTDWLAGMPYPIFYAFLFYPLAAVLAAVVGADWALRLVAIGLLAIQTWQVRKLVRAAGGKEGVDWLAAAALAWAAYALTNLYTRGAVAEFVAVSLLISATASFLRSALPGEHGSRGRLGFQGAFFYALSAGSHPITALFGTLFLGCVLPPLLLTSWRKVLPGLLAGAVAALVMLAPWFYLMGKFKGTLSVERDTMRQVNHYTSNLDSVQSRLWPWPRDARVAEAKSLEDVSTPYLDAQISMPLLLLAAAVSFRAWRNRGRSEAGARAGFWLMGVSWGVFAGAFLLSVWPAPWRWLPGILSSVQYAYRLVSYQNLALLTALTGACLTMASGSSKTWLPGRQWIQRGLWAVAVAGVGVMLSHVLAIQHSPNPDLARCQRDPNYHAHTPHSFYGWAASSVLGGHAKTNQPAREIYLDVGVRDHFGEVSPTRFELAAPENVCLQVQPFPWNHVYLDGERLDEARTHTRPQGYTLTLPAGKHEVACLWQPDSAWVWLDMLSKFMTLAGGLTVIGLAVRETRWVRSAGTA